MTMSETSLQPGPETISSDWSPDAVRAIRAMFAADLTLLQEGPPERWYDPYACETVEVKGSLTCAAQARHHAFTIDEPTQFGGRDTAPNPVEAVLGALGASLQVTARLFATQWGLGIDRLRTTMTAQLDIRGFYGTDPAVPAGLSTLAVTLFIASDMAENDFARLAAQIRRGCPVYGLLGGDAKVELTIEREGIPA